MDAEKNHKTLSGLTVTYTPTPAVAAFVDRVATMATNSAVTEDELVATVYGPANPILDPAPIPGRGAVTAAVLADPAYRVLTDLIFRKHVAEQGVDVAKMAARYTLTVSEAAERLGVTRSAVHQAIDAGRLGAWVKGDRLYVGPDALASLKLSPRGPKPKRAAGEPPRASSEPLRYEAGTKDGYTLHVRHVGGAADTGRDGSAAFGSLRVWRRVGVLTSGKDGRARFFVLEPAAAPAADEEVLAFGPLSVRGRFVVAQKLNGDKAARAAWEAFEPA